MKKIMIIFCLGCILLPASIHAQANKGRILLAGSSRYGFNGSGSADLLSLGYSLQKVKSDAQGFSEGKGTRIFNFNFGPRIGYFIINSLVIGADICLGYGNFKDLDSDYYWRNSSFIAGPFIRYYIPLKKAMPYAETTAGFGSAHTKLENLEGQDEAYKDKDNLILVTAGAGVAFIITERVSFDLMGGYSFYRQKDPDDNPDNVRYTTGSFGLRFGVSMYLGKK